MKMNQKKTKNEPKMNQKSQKFNKKQKWTKKTNMNKKIQKLSQKWTYSAPEVSNSKPSILQTAPSKGDLGFF